MSKNKKNENEDVVVKPKKKKMTAAQKNKIMMQIMTWFIVGIMVFGVLISIFGPMLFN